eukprot:Skav218702  [mRNA]  locus=scaffold1346:398017:398566:- [translate_table: standard]
MATTELAPSAHRSWPRLTRRGEAYDDLDTWQKRDVDDDDGYIKAPRALHQGYDANEVTAGGALQGLNAWPGPVEARVKGGY